MEKGMIVEDRKRSGGDRITVSLLAAALLVLSLTFIVLAVCGTVYLNSERHEAHNHEITIHTASEKAAGTNSVSESGPKTEEPEATVPPLEFYLGVPRIHFNNVTMVHQYILVDEQAGTEFIVFKDPEMLHIQNLVFVDHQNDVQVLYGSELAQCFLVRDRVHSMGDNLRYLWHYNGANVSQTTNSYDYKSGPRVTSVEDIPHQMAGFCSPANTYWLVEARSHDWMDSERYHVCTCSYFYCWCTYCAVEDCWGRCSTCNCPSCEDSIRAA